MSVNTSKSECNFSQFRMSHTRYRYNFILLTSNLNTQKSNLQRSTFFSPFIYGLKNQISWEYGILNIKFFCVCFITFNVYESKRYRCKKYFVSVCVYCTIYNWKDVFLCVITSLVCVCYFYYMICS